MAVEGNSFTNLLKLMKTQGFNKDNHVTIGKVTSIVPLKILIDSIEISEGDFYIAQRLTEHTRKMWMEVSEMQTPIPTTPEPTEAFRVTEGKIMIKDPLKVGDLVIVLIDENEFFVMDRVVR
jgi:hypothetical protein